MTKSDNPYFLCVEPLFLNYPFEYGYFKKCSRGVQFPAPRLVPP
jgi:hypothetical protein